MDEASRASLYKSLASEEVSSVKLYCDRNTLSHDIKSTATKEVCDQELRDLHYQHSFNARLILQALCRKLIFIREDLDLPFGASTSSMTTAADVVLLRTLNRECRVLDQINTCFYNVDRSHTAYFAAEFYVGFWDAWGTIRDIGRARLVDDRYLSGLEVIEDARLDIYFPNRFEDSSILTSSIRSRSCTNFLGLGLGLASSISQSDLYFDEAHTEFDRDQCRSLAALSREQLFSMQQHRLPTAQMTRASGESNLLGPGDLRCIHGSFRHGQFSIRLRDHVVQPHRSNCHNYLDRVKYAQAHEEIDSTPCTRYDTGNEESYSTVDSEENTIASFACRGIESSSISSIDVATQNVTAAAVKVQSVEKAQSTSIPCSSEKRRLTLFKDFSDTCNQTSKFDTNEPDEQVVDFDLDKPSETLQTSHLTTQDVNGKQVQTVLKPLIEDNRRTKGCSARAKSSHHIDFRHGDVDSAHKLLPDNIFDHERSPLEPLALNSVSLSRGLKKVLVKPHHHAKKGHRYEHGKNERYLADQLSGPSEAKNPPKSRRVIPGLRERMTRFELD